MAYHSLVSAKSDGGDATLVRPSDWNAPHTFIGCKAYNSTTQSITTATLTALTFNTEEYDTSSFHSTSSNTSRMVVPTTGYYRLTGYFYMASGTGQKICQFYKNGTTTLRSQALFTSAAGGVINTTVVQLTAADYVEVRAYQNSGGSVNAGDASNTEQQNFFAIELLGV
jgi:hypothetical protein